MYKGVEMTAKSFDTTMAWYDINQFIPLGEMFDPNLHEAMYLFPDPSKKAGTIT